MVSKGNQSSSMTNGFDFVFPGPLVGMDCRRCPVFSAFTLGDWGRSSGLDCRFAHTLRRTAKSPSLWLLASVRWASVDDRSRNRRECWKSQKVSPMSRTSWRNKESKISFRGVSYVRVLRAPLILRMRCRCRDASI